MRFLTGKTPQTRRRLGRGGRAAARLSNRLRWPVALVAVTAGASLVCAAPPPQVVIYDADVDGRSVGFPASPPEASAGRPDAVSAQVGSLRIARSLQTLGFRFGPAPGTLNFPVRLRYRLKGFDSQWRESGGDMRLHVRFLDVGRNTVSARDFSASGESVGWAGTVARSRFVRRHEEVTVPNRTAWVEFELFSGGSEPTMGVMAIDDLTLAVAGKSNQPPARVFSSKSVEWRAEDGENSVPDGWVRDGSLPSIAQMASTGETKPRYVLAVIDRDPARWGAWRTDRPIPVTPGESLVLEWSEMFSIGWGADAWARYSHLPPNSYTFHVRAATETGEWTTGEAVVAVAVVPPIWQRTWFRLTLFGLGVASLMAGVRYTTWRRMQTRLEAIERQGAVERERARIARDIHDDLGANLTQIALLSELAQTDMDDPGLARAHLRQIFSAARAMTRQLDEIVWAVDPANDSVEETTGYLCKFAQDFFRTTNIRCRLDVPESSLRLAVSSAERHNLFLVAKEAFNNIVKHAQATEVWLRIRNEARDMVLEIEDNGLGFDQPEAPNVGPSGVGGHGIQNMKKRMARIGARFEQHSEPGKGTKVRVVLSLGERRV